MPPRHSDDSNQVTGSIKEDVANVMKELIANDPEYISLKDQMKTVIAAINNHVNTEVRETIQKEIEKIKGERIEIDKTCKKISEDRVAIRKDCKNLTEDGVAIARDCRKIWMDRVEIAKDCKKISADRVEIAKDCKIISANRVEIARDCKKIDANRVVIEMYFKKIEAVRVPIEKNVKKIEAVQVAIEKDVKKIEAVRVAIEKYVEKISEKANHVGRLVSTEPSSSQQQNVIGESVPSGLVAKIDKIEEKLNGVSVMSLSTKTTFTKDIFELKKQVVEHMALTGKAVQGLRSLQDAVVSEKIQYLRQAILDRTVRGLTRPLPADESLNVETAIDTHIIQTRFISCTLHNFRSMLNVFTNTHQVLMTYTPNEWHVRGRHPHLVREAQAHLSSFHNMAKVFDISEEIAPKMLFKVRKEGHSTKTEPVFRMAQLFGSRLFRDEEGVEKCYILPGVPENYNRFLQFGTPSHVHVFKLESTEFSESSFTDKLSLSLESGDILTTLFQEKKDELTFNSAGDEEGEEPAGITLHWKPMEKKIFKYPTLIDEECSLGWVYVSIPIVHVRDPRLIQVLNSEFENNDAL